MKTKTIRRKVRQITDIVEDVEEWMYDNSDELYSKVTYEASGLEEKITEIKTLAERAIGTLHTIETRTEGD